MAFCSLCRLGSPPKQSSQQLLARAASTLNYVGSLSPAAGSTHKKQRVGRGDSSGRGNSAGRGQKGQLARSGGKVGRHFEGGQTPLTRAFAKRGFTPPTSLPVLPLPLHRLLEWIKLGRIDSSQPITLRELQESQLVKNIPQGGVKLLGDPLDMHRQEIPPINIILNRASTSVIKAIENAGGSVICRYYNALGIRAVAKPESFHRKGIAIPRLADPIKKSDIEYYSRLDKRGYLALKAAAGQLAAGPPKATESDSHPSRTIVDIEDDPANEKGSGDHGVTDIVPEEDVPATNEDLRGGI